MPEALQYKEKDNVLYIRAEGHMTAALCADLRSLVFGRLDAEPAVTGIKVDLSACAYMDSTFMGLLVGFNKRLARAKAGKLLVVRPTAPAKELLSGLGLLPLIDLTDDAVPFPADMADVVKTRTTGADLLLKAHENLMELSEENARRFSALHSVLKSQAEDKTKNG